MADTVEDQSNLDPLTGNPIFSELPQPFADRFNLHATEAFRTGVSIGPLSMGTAGKYDEFERMIREDITDPATKAEYTGLLEKWQKGDAEANEQIKDRLTAYKLMPKAETAGDYSAAVLGSLAGGALGPESLIAPELKVATTAFRAAHPILTRILGVGAGQAAVQGATDPVVQSLAIRAGAEDHYDWVRSAMTPPCGFPFGVSS